MSWKLLPDKKIQLLSTTKVLEQEECDKILSDLKGADHHSFVNGNEFSYSHIVMEPRMFGDVYEKVTSAVLDSVVNNYGFKVHSIPALYYVEFDKSQFMDWSMDLAYSGRETAKLSLHIPLNEDYDDGNFIVRTPRDTIVSPKPGVLTIFPSFVASRQDKPSRGIKKAILGTIAGLPFT